MAFGDHSNDFHPPRQKLRGRALLLSFIFFILMLAFVIYYFSEIKKDVTLLKKVNPYLLILAIIFQLLTYLFAANVYRLLLGQDAHQLKLRDLIKATVISLVFNQTIPSAGISGNTFMLTFLRRFNIKMAAIADAILADLLTFYMAMECVLIFFLISAFTLSQLPHLFKGVLAGGLLIYPALGLLIIFAGSKRFLIFFNKLTKIKFIKNIFRNLYANSARHDSRGQGIQLLTFLKQNRHSSLAALLFQLLVFFADGLTIYALFHGLSVHIHLYSVLLGFACTKIIALLPALPGALILFESSMSYFFVSLNMPLSTAIIVTMLYRLLSFWFPIPIGMLLYRRWLKETPGK